MRPAIAPALDVNLVWFSELDSTNAAAARLVTAWADDEDDRLRDTVIIAGAQTAGRGRNAHAWASPTGGLYATWLGWLPAAALGWLPLAAGVGLAGAVEELLPGGSVKLKWPNDLLAGGKKLGGLLCQSRTRGDAAWAAVGFGVNVEVVPHFAEGVATEACCLRSLGLDAGIDVAAWTIVGSFIRRLRASLERPEGIRAAWLERAVHRPGDRIRIRVAEEIVIGAYVGLAEDGGLELEVGERRCRFAAGELVGVLPAAEG
jgi:BirA family biotin operon repressor/biotin-[acetyl-CoA-carboxylase] ligase